MNSKVLFIISIAFIFCSCSSSAISQVNQITDFESCVAAGNKVLRMYPPKCVAPGIGMFTKKIEAELALTPEASDFSQPSVSSEPASFCEDTCGDGECAEIVCQALGCPCAESPDSCPQDCKPLDP